MVFMLDQCKLGYKAVGSTYQGGGPDGGKVVAVAIVGSAASSRGSLGLVHLRLVGVVVDVILTLGGGGAESHTFNHTHIKSSGAALGRRRVFTVGRWMMELLEVTVCSPSCIMAISLLLSSEASARLLTELL